MLKTPFYCALTVCLAAGILDAQTSSKEYIRIGGRVIAIENSSVTVTSPASYTATTGMYFSAQLAASGGSGTYTWSWSGLPSWLSISGAGILSGTAPSSPGTSNFTVTATDSSGLLSGSLAVSVTFNSTGLNITTSSLPGVVVNAPYSTTLVATGGTGTLTWSGGAGLPAGMTLSSGTGTISGTPTAVTDSSFTVTVTDSVGNSANTTLSIDVVSQLTITTSGLATTECSGSGYSQTVSASGGQTPYTWGVASGSSLPTGYTIGASTGTIAGPCLLGGSSVSVKVQVNDSLTPTALTATSPPYTIVPNPVLTGPASFPGPQVGYSYSETVTASGGTQPYSWSAPGLPNGLNIASNTGVVTGTPTGPSGTSNVTVTVTDATGWKASKVFSITVTAGLVITTPSGLPSATAGQSYYQSFNVQGGSAPYTWTLVSGGLPSGMSLSSSGVLSGDPYEGTPGTYPYSPGIRVTDSSSPALSAPGSFSLQVYAPQTSGPNVSPGSSSATPGGAAVLIYSYIPGDGNNTIASTWALSGTGVGNYGAGSLSPMSSSTYTYYTAPTAVLYDQIADVTATDSGGSSSGTLLMNLPTPTVTLAGAAMTGQTVQVDTGQNFTLSITASLGDNWSSANDNVNVYFEGAAGFCQIFYYPALRTVYLGNDGLPGLSGGFSSGTIGTAGSLSTGSCTVGLNGSATYNSQGYLMTVNLPISFSGVENGVTAAVNVIQPNTIWTMGSVSIVTPGVTLTPTTVTMGPRQTQQFTATVAGESNTAVNWTLNSTQLGSVSSSGLYTSPLSLTTQQTVRVTATSQANGALSATSVVTLSPTACGTTDLNLPNTTLTSGTTTDVGGRNVIANSGFSISGSAVVSFQACNQIVLGPGFKAVAGSGGNTFTTVIY